jgi:uncharacterized membrane protein
MTIDYVQTLRSSRSLSRLHGGFLAAAAVAALPLAATAGGYNFEQINYPGDNFTQLLGVNNATLIAGYHGSGATPANPNQGLVVTPPSTFASENFPSSAQTQVVGINNNGDTAGFYIDVGGATHGFQRIGGTFTSIDAPGAAFTQLLGINDAQVLAGYYSADPGGATPQTAFLQFPLNPSFGGLSGSLYSLTTSLNGLGSTSAQATGVNNNLAVSGFYVDAGGVNHGFFFSKYNQTPVTIDYPGATFTQALGLNNLGEVVGDYIDASGAMHGFLDVHGALQSIDDPLGVGTTVVNGINDKGQLVGFFVDAAGATEGFLASPAPDAGSTLGLLALGLAALAVTKAAQRPQRFA